MITIAILIILWLIIGAAGYIFWWTKDFDFTTREIGMAFCASIMGIISWGIGYTIHGKPFKGKESIIIKKRTQ